MFYSIKLSVIVILGLTKITLLFGHGGEREQRKISISAASQLDCSPDYRVLTTNCRNDSHVAQSYIKYLFEADKKHVTKYFHKSNI